MSHDGRVLTRGRRLAAALAGLLALATGPASAQTADCQRLRAALDALGPTDGGGESLYGRAAERQRAELDRTRDYAASVGCGNPADNAFDDDQPRQCAALADRVARMDDNLRQIEARGRQLGGDSGERARLAAQVSAACSPSPEAPQASPDAGDAPPDANDVSAVPPGGDISGGDDRPAPHGTQAICVRSCDGGFFPLGKSGAAASLDHLDQLCKASCPNTEAHLYTMAEGGKLDDATSVDGQPYAALPAAHVFEKRFTPSCTCKPPGQSWVQALADADKLITPHEGDVTVTKQMSEDMAKPLAPPPAPPAAKVKGRRRGGSKPAPAAPPDAAVDLAPPPDVPAPAVASGSGAGRLSGRGLRTGLLPAAP